MSVTMHTAVRMHTAGRMSGVRVRIRVRVNSSGVLNVSLISRHVAVCTAGHVMITNDSDTIYTAGHVSASVYNFSLMLSNFTDHHLLTTK